MMARSGPDGKHPVQLLIELRQNDTKETRAASAAVTRDDREETLHVHRLLEILVDLERLGASFELPGTGEHDDWKLREGGIGDLLATKLPPVFAGHHEIEQDEARLETGAELLERFLPVTRGDDTEALLLKQCFERRTCIGIVLDDEDTGRHVGVHPFEDTAGPSVGKCTSRRQAQALEANCRGL
jgi:hypothetical protein